MTERLTLPIKYLPEVGIYSPQSFGKHKENIRRNAYYCAEPGGRTTLGIQKRAERSLRKGRFR